MAACSGITGTPSRAVLRSSILPSRLAKKPRAALSAVSALTGSRLRKFPSSSIPWSRVPCGDSVYRGASFLAGKLGEKIAGANVNIIDDGTIPGGFGTAPFDGEGIPTRRTVVVENGILKSYLLNTYTARKLGLETTANASRGLAGTPGIGPGNYFLQPGTKTPKQIIADIKDGLYVTEFMGHGSNLVTGDYSRGASGMWIVNGELAYPVEEITVAGNLKEMFNNISEIGSDLEFRGSMASPTIRIDGLTVGGE
jgi:PmbA protein